MSEETRTFDGAIEKFKSWSQVRLDESEDSLLVQHCLLSIRSPANDPRLLRLWNEFHDLLLPEINERLENNDWANTEGRALVLLSTASLEIRKGMRNFLPPPFSETL